jgi:CheY-like chemotaxis protein
MSGTRSDDVISITRPEHVATRVSEAEHAASQGTPGPVKRTRSGAVRQHGSLTFPSKDGADSEQVDGPLVLIAERDRTVRELQTFFLRRAGFRVVFVDDGNEALAFVRASPPALVIAEILIPKLDGLTVCRELRGDPATRNVPVIVFSILAAAARAAEAGASVFLRKPLIEDAFLAAVEMAMTNNAAAPEQQ